jgi:hypothetical protein
VRASRCCSDWSDRAVRPLAGSIRIPPRPAPGKGASQAVYRGGPTGVDIGSLFSASTASVMTHDQAANSSQHNPVRG